MRDGRDGRVLTLLDLEDIKRIEDGARVRRMAWITVGISAAFIIMCAIAWSVVKREGRSLVSAKAEVAKLTVERDALKMRLAKYDSMMAVSLDARRLERPVRLSGELIVMFAGEVDK